jgi:hypothetical protein
MSTTTQQDSGRRLAAETGHGRRFPTVDLAVAAERIRRLHEQVCGHGQRVEITRDGCDDVCVLISKRELEALEAAVAIHASTAAHADLCRQLSDLLNAAGLVYQPYAYGNADRTFADDCTGSQPAA